MNLSLSNGAAMPAVGLGFWKLGPADVAHVVPAAIQAGYRHFDCACDYGNEAEVGSALAEALANGLCRREDLWLTSKLWNTYHAPQHVRPALERSLRDLRVDYLDLYLIHFPISLKYVPFDKRYPPEWIFDPAATTPRMEFEHVPMHDTWRAMEDLVRSGLVRNIGVCNFNCSLLRDLLSYASIRPAVLQVELHPYLTQEKLLRFCHEERIAVTGFSPLGAHSYFQLNMADARESVLDQPVIREIAQRHQKTPAQVVLRWGVQRGTAVIPKTSSIARLSENLAVFDFALTADEMAAVAGLDRNRRFNDPGVFCEQAFGTFCPIYE